jgi:hypothetical protein
MKSFLKNYKKKIATAFLVVAVVAIGTSQATATPISLGTAADFAVLGGTTVTNTGNTIINGDLGVSPGSAITGFPPGIVNGTIHAGDADAASAHTDANAAYNAAAGATGGTPGPNDTNGLGGATLFPGVYTYAAAAPWSDGNLTLDGNSNPNAQWIFQIGTALTTPINATVLLINGASANNVFWQMGSSLTLGANNTFAGNILANTSITLGGGTLNGRALAINGAVTISVAETLTVNVPENDTNDTNDTGNTGNILVYKLVAHLNPKIEFTDANNTIAKISVDNGTAYMVLDVNTDTWELNAAPKIIGYWKDGKEKRYHSFDANEKEGDFEIFDIQGTAYKGVLGYVWWEDVEDEGSFRSALYGKCTRVDIGRVDKSKVQIPRSLKGIAECWDLDTDGDEEFGNMTLTFDSKYTKNANDSTPETQAATVAKIIDDLEAKHYVSID